MLGLWLIKGIVFIYDIITYPIYFILDQPWKALKQIHSPRSQAHEEPLVKRQTVDNKIVEEEESISVETWTCHWPKTSSKELQGKTPHGICDTFAASLSCAMKIHSGKKALGYRMIMGVEEPTAEDAVKNGVMNDVKKNGVNGSIIRENGHHKKRIHDETITKTNKNDINNKHDVNGNNHNHKSNGKIPASNGVANATSNAHTSLKPMKKKILSSEYTWINYDVLDKRLEDLVFGLESLGVKYQDKVTVILETRLEWSLAAYSIIRMGSVLCTMFSTLGVEGFMYGINELESEVVITNFENAKSILSNLDKLPSIKKVVVVVDKPLGDSVDQLPVVEGVEVFDFSTLETRGRDLRRSQPNLKRQEPQPQDLALIMYSSGTTGKPKGVMFTQKMLASAYDVGFSTIFDRVWPEEMQQLNDPSFQPFYMSYLPIAHIFEFMFNSMLFQSGFAIGFATPFTVFEGSIALSKDSLPDVKVLNPHVICTVPLILERIKSKIKEQLKSKPLLVQEIFFFGIDYKRYWNSRGFQTRIMDSILFKKTHDILGSNCRIVLSGSAPLAAETHRFMRSVLNVKLIQGYGTTETQALVMVQDNYDYCFGSSGFSHDNMKLKLQDWKEGGYSVSDKPNPRGELLIGGDHVSLGYFKKEEETKESFFTDEKGLLWFVSGDIVSIDKDKGTVTIIDRKKDLIKLQNGEFVALGKIEAALKDDPIVDNVLVTASSFDSFVVAVVLPERDQLIKLAKSILGEDMVDRMSFQEICFSERVVSAVRASIIETSNRVGLKRIEVPVNIFITDQEWTPTSGLVTASFKIKRRALLDHYVHQVNQMITSKGRS